MLTVLQEHLWTSEWLLSGFLCWAVCFKNQHRRGGQLGEGIFSFALGLPVFSWHHPTNCFFPSVLIPNFEPSPQELLHSIQWCFRDLIVVHGPIFTTDQNNSVTLQFFFQLTVKQWAWYVTCSAGMSVSPKWMVLFSRWSEFPWCLWWLAFILKVFFEEPPGKDCVRVGAAGG